MIEPIFRGLLVLGLAISFATAPDVFGQSGVGPREDRADGASRSRDESRGEEGGRERRGRRGDRAGRGRPGGFGGGRGGFPGGGGFGGGARLLENEAVRQELSLTDEQFEKIQAVAEEFRPDRSAMFEAFSRMRAAETDEEQAAIRAEIEASAREAAAKANEAIQAVLSPQQYTRYQQATRQQAGIRGLLNGENAELLGLSEDQQTKLSEAAQAASDRFRELRDLPEDERDAAREEIESGIYNILTTEQRAKWDELLGEPIEGLSDGRSRSSDRRPRRESATAPSEPSEAAEPVRQSSVSPSPVKVIEPSGPSTADFGERVGTLSFKFQNAPWSSVLRLFADSAGLTLDMETVPPGAFTYFDPAEYTPEQALDVLNRYLLSRGFILLKRDNFLAVTPISDGISPNLIPTVTVDSLETRGRSELVRVVFDTGLMPAKDLAEDVLALLGPQGKTVAMGSSNRMIAEGLVENLISARDFLENSTKKLGPTEVAFRAFRLQHIRAVDAEPLIATLVGIDRGAALAGGDSRSRSSRDPRTMFYEMMRSRMGGGDRGGRGNDRNSRGGSSADAAGNEADPKVVVDGRTNSLLVSATVSQLQIIEDALKTIDVPEGAGVSTAGDESGPTLRVYTIEDGDLGEISQTLEAMVGGVLINTDNRADQLHVIATAEQHQQVRELIRLIDGTAGGMSVAVLPLNRTDATTAAVLVSGLFGSRDGEAPLMQPDPSGRRLLVRGSTAQVDEVKSLLTQMGELGTEVGSERPRGPVREIPLNGRDPSELLRMVDQIWNARSDQPLLINGASRRERPRTSQTSEPKSRRNSNDEASVRRPAKTWPVSQDAEAIPESPEKPPLTITSDGGRLVISSTDQEALDELEAIIAYAQQQLTPKTQWSVYYLRAASADDAVALLREFYPGLIESELSTSLSPAGDSLRVVSETRTNALFLSGPEQILAEVENLLRVIDATDVPNSINDRLARTIPVEHANASEVAQVLKEVFSDQLPQRRQSQRRGEEGEPTIVPGTMTISVDTNASQIVVSANDTMFSQVEALVQTLDESARNAKRTVRVMSLENAAPSVVQGMLGSLYPKVTISTSSTNSTSRRQQTPPRENNTSERSSSSRDDFRRFFEERSRQRDGSRAGAGNSSRRNPGPPDGGRRGRGR